MEEQDVYVRTASKSLCGSICHDVRACLAMANARPHTDFRVHFCTCGFLVLHMKHLEAL